MPMSRPVHSQELWIWNRTRLPCMRSHPGALEVWPTRLRTDHPPGSAASSEVSEAMGCRTRVALLMLDRLSRVPLQGPSPNAASNTKSPIGRFGRNSSIHASQVFRKFRIDGGFIEPVNPSPPVPVAQAAKFSQTPNCGHVPALMRYPNARLVVEERGLG